MNKDVDALKNRLRNYNHDKEQIKTLEEKKEYCYHLLGGDARSVDPSKEPLHCQPNKEREYEIRDTISQLDEKIGLLQAEIKYLDNVLDNVGNKHRDAIKMVLIDRIPIYKVCTKYYIGKSTLQDRIDKELERALKL